MSAPQQVILPMGGSSSGTISVINAWKDYGPGGGGTPKSVSVSPLAGSLLVVAIIESSTATTSGCAVTDNIGGATGWVNLGGGIGSSIGIVWFYKPNIPAGITTLSVTSDTGASATIIVHEVANADPTSPFNFSEYLVQSYTSTTNPQSANILNAYTPSLCFATCANTDTASSVTYTLNGTGTTHGTWALHSSTNSQELDATAHVTASIPYVVVSTVASTVHGWTTNSFPGVNSIVIFS